MFARSHDASLKRAAVVVAVTVASLVAGAQSARADELPGLNGAPAPIIDQASPAPAPAPSPNTVPQVSPPQNTNAAPAPQATSGPSAPLPGRRANEARGLGNRSGRFEHWELNPTLFWTFSTGRDVIPPRGWSVIPKASTEPPDILRITGDARYRFNRKYFLVYQRIDHTGGSGRTKPVTISKANPNGGTFSGQSEDYEERFLLGDQLNQYLTVRGGYALRTRTCCPGAGDPNAQGLRKNLNPRIHTGFFSDISWRFGPDTIGGKPWTTSFRWEEYAHHPPNPNPVPPAVTDEGVKPTFNFTLYSNFFFYHQTKLVPYYGIEYFSTYFSYSPRMTETYRKVYGVSWRATRDWTNRFYVKNDQSGGVLASSGDSAHKSSLFIESSYRLHW
jgi:hypothetical protein